MTFRNKIDARLQNAGRMLSLGRKLTFFPILFWVVFAGVNHFAGLLDGLDAVAMLIMLAVLVTTFAGWIVELKAKRLAFATSPCPGCQKELNYLVIDPSFSKRPIWGLPPELTKNVTECPYCGTSFEKE